jgi:MoxR-like ATPase
MMISTGTNLNPKCSVCGHAASPWLGDHLAESHDLTVVEYLAKYPGAATASQSLIDSYEGASKRRRKAAEAAGLAVDFAGVSFPVDTGVPASACLPMPAHYNVPVHGDLAGDIQDVAVAVKRSRSVWVWGAPGTGKDAVFSALCAMTRRPSLLFTVVQGADITAWKFTRSFDANGTKWEEGALLRALRDGYTTPDGRTVPYLIVLSDFDRATRSQAEELRQILDSIQGRISGPTGEVYPVLPGTTIVATANSSGAGDTTGRCISANPIDSSILDRFERKVRFRPMDARDEEPILRAKFPILAARHPDALGIMMRSTTAIRAAVDKEEVYCEWSHRTVCAWAGAAEDLAETVGGKLKTDRLVARAARAVLDGMPDADTRDKVKRLIDPFLKGGMVGEGDTSHIGTGPVATY